MITDVRLENWKAYRSFQIRPQAGTTFLVAANGVGKSSFLDAVQWALDPDAKPHRDLMRRRATTTTVDVTVVADDATVRIKRTLTAGRGKTPKLELAAWVDEKLSSAEKAFAVLAASWEADSRFVSRAAFLRERFLDQKEEPALRGHLTRLHSLDRLQRAIDLLVPAENEAKKLADAARFEAERVEASVGAALARRTAANEAAQAARARAQELRTVSEEVSARLDEVRRVRQAVVAREAWEGERRSLVADVGSLVEPPGESTPLVVYLRAAEAGARQQLLQVTDERARLRERLASFDEALLRLRNAEGECPVCRRALDDASREHAEHAHLADREAAASALSTVGVDAASDVANRLRRLVIRAEQLGEAPPLPDGMDVGDVQALEREAAEAKAVFEASLADVGRAEQEERAASAELTALEPQQGADRASSLYLRVAAYEAAILALRGTITEVLDSQLGPVRDEVNRRWVAVFPDRPGLRLDPDGRIVRSFPDGGDDLELSSFSAGERVVARLMLRLATLTATTAVPFCWIDEPLEHLDPDARSYVGRTLAYLSGVGALKQIFVTTYEQALALQLASDSPDQVHLEFLMTAQVTQ